MSVVRIPVELGERSYDVIVGRGVRSELASVIRDRAPKALRAVVVTSEALVSMPWAELETGLSTTVLTVPDGEAAKVATQVERLCTEFSRLELSRHDVIVSLGGGSVTDLAGFAAAVYLRGIAVVHVATSLVAQVDAAVGGKTGVNLATGKNLMGAFHQPLAVLCDLELLETLSPREIQDGRGEIVKCCLLTGMSLGDIDAATSDQLITMAISYKCSIVAADEREGGLRALLNYGHTLAHAIEALQLDGEDLDIRHGEAVAVGLAFAARLARRLGRLDNAGVQRHDDALAFFGLSGSLPAGLSAIRLLEAMGRDKKAHHNLTFVLAGENGYETVSDLNPEVVLSELVNFGGVA